MASQFDYKRKSLESIIEGLQCFKCKGVPGFTQEQQNRYSCPERNVRIAKSQYLLRISRLLPLLLKVPSTYLSIWDLLDFRIGDVKLDQNECGSISYRSEIAFDQNVVFAFLSKGTCHRPLTMQASVVCK